MTKPKTLSAEDLIKPPFTGTPRQLDVLVDLLRNSDPLKDNPWVKLDYYCALIRPDECATANFAWQGLITKYGMSSKDVRLLFYIHRMILAYSLQGLRTSELQAPCEIDNH